MTFGERVKNADAHWKARQGSTSSRNTSKVMERRRTARVGNQEKRAFLNIVYRAMRLAF